VVDASAIAGAAWRMPGEQRGAEQAGIRRAEPKAIGFGVRVVAQGTARRSRLRGAATPIWCWCTPPKTSSRH
jgi:hypothetical protein